MGHTIPGLRVKRATLGYKTQLLRSKGFGWLRLLCNLSHPRCYNLLMVISCALCGTRDFAVKGKAVDMAFVCEKCGSVMCLSCAGCDYEGEIPLLCCFQCRSRSVRYALDDQGHQSNRE